MTPLAYAFERPDQPEVIALIEQLDAFQIPLYPAESNHILDIAALCDPSVSFLVARQAGAPVACGAIKMDSRGWGELKRMFTLPECRGQGIAREILRRPETEALRSRFGLMRLETGIYNSEALRLYERAGFSRCPPSATTSRTPTACSWRSGWLDYFFPSRKKRTQTGIGASSFCPVGVSVPVFPSILKTTSESLF